MRSPGSQAKSVRTCQCLRPRRAVWALALSRPAVLPSVTGTTSAPRMRVLSRLNGWPMRSPVNASPRPSRASAHELGVDAVRYSFIVMDFHHLLLAGLPAHPGRLPTGPWRPPGMSFHPHPDRSLAEPAEGFGTKRDGVPITRPPRPQAQAQSAPRTAPTAQAPPPARRGDRGP